MEQSQPSGAFRLASKATTPLKINATEMQLTWQKSSRLSQVLQDPPLAVPTVLACLSMQPWVRDYKTGFLGCFVREPLVFTAMAKGL